MKVSKKTKATDKATIDTARRLKWEVATVQTATENGPQPITMTGPVGSGWACGLNDDDLWTVTHTPTGQRAMLLDCPLAASIAVQALATHAPLPEVVLSAPRHVGVVIAGITKALNEDFHGLVIQVLTAYMNRDSAVLTVFEANADGPEVKT